MLNRQQILALDDLKTRDVEVPEWQTTVRVRMMTGTERDRLVGLLDDKSPAGVASFRLGLVVSTLVDDTGVRVFSDEDAPLIGGKASTAIERIFAAASDLNRLAGTAVEDAGKNLPAAPSGASSSDGPSPSAELPASSSPT